MEHTGDMTLLLAVVQREDAGALVEDVNRRGHGATRIGAVGGFLRVGNDVVLVGVDDRLVPDVLAAVQATCRTRTAYIASPAADPSIGVMDGLIGPIEVEVGGAVVFAVPVERHIRLLGRGNGRVPEDDGRASRAGGWEMASKLVVAIVQDQDAGHVVEALVSQRYGATRINTAGGFLKRGNSTILVGVQEEEVERVVETIDANCQARQAHGIGSDVTVGAGTVFVLGVSEFIRL